MQNWLQLWMQNLKSYDPNQSKPGFFDAGAKQRRSMGQFILRHPKIHKPVITILIFISLLGEVQEVDQGCHEQTPAGEGKWGEDAKVRGRVILS